MIVGTRSSTLAIAEFEELKLQLPTQDLRHFFYSTKAELENALSSGEIDMSVGSAKDKIVNKSIVECALSDSIDSRNALVSTGDELEDIEEGSIIAISNLNIKDYIKELNEKVKVILAKGAINKRINKVGVSYDGLIIAYAALIRLGMENLATQIFTTSELPTNMNQGRLSIRTRDDKKSINRIQRLLELNEGWTLTNNN